MSAVTTRAEAGTGRWSHAFRATVACLAAAAAAILVWGRTVEFAYAYDDIPLVVENARLQSAQPLERWWSEPRPVRYLTFAAERALWGGGPVGSHAVNISLHAAVAVLATLLGMRLLGGVWGGVLTGLLVAVHPLAAESVSIVSHRKELLSAAFLVGGLRLAAARSPWSWIAGLAGGIGVLANERMAAFPFLVALLFAVDRRRDGKPGMGRYVLLVAWCAVVAGAAAGFVCWSRGLRHEAASGIAFLSAEAGQIDPAMPAAARLLTGLQSLGLYACDLVWPTGRGMDPAIAGGASLTGAGVLAGLLALAGYACAGAALARRRSPLALGWLWPGVILAPAVALAIVGGLDLFVYAARYAYLALPGVALMAACLLHGRRWGRAIGLALCGAYAAAAWTAAGPYRSDEALWRWSLERNPRSAAAAANLGACLAGRGATSEALGVLRSAVRSHPRHALATHNLATVLARAGYPGEVAALAASGTAGVRGVPGSVWLQLALSLEQRGATRDALECCRAAWESIHPEPDAFDVLVRCAIAARQEDEAVAWLENLLCSDPVRAEAWIALGGMRERRLRLGSAEGCYRIALRIAPRDVAGRERLAALLLRRGDRTGAIRAYEEVLALDPQRADAARMLRFLREVSPVPGAVLFLTGGAGATEGADERLAVVAGTLAGDQGRWRSVGVGTPGTPGRAGAVGTALMRERPSQAVFVLDEESLGLAAEDEGVRRALVAEVFLARALGGRVAVLLPPGCREEAEPTALALGLFRAVGIDLLREPARAPAGEAPLVP